jgi:hypothetical protein
LTARPTQFLLDSSWLLGLVRSGFLHSVHDGFGGFPCLLLYTLRYWHISQVRPSGLPVSITEQMVGHADDRTHRGYTRPVEGQEAVIRAALAQASGGSDPA